VARQALRSASRPVRQGLEWD